MKIDLKVVAFLATKLSQQEANDMIRETSKLISKASGTIILYSFSNFARY